MKAVKNNKEYTIDETMKESYRKDGFDIYGDDGKLIAYGTGKTVPYETYMAVKNELDKLKESGEKRTTRGAKA